MFWFGLYANNSSQGIANSTLWPTLTKMGLVTLSLKHTDAPRSFQYGKVVRAAG